MKKMQQVLGKRTMIVSNVRQGWENGDIVLYTEIINLMWLRNYKATMRRMLERREKLAIMSIIFLLHNIVAVHYNYEIRSTTTVTKSIQKCYKINYKNAISSSKLNVWCSWNKNR